MSHEDLPEVRPPAAQAQAAALKSLVARVLTEGAAPSSEGKLKLSDGTSVPDAVARFLKERGLVAARPDGGLQPTGEGAGIRDALSGPRAGNIELDVSRAAPLRHVGESPVARLAIAGSDGEAFLNAREVGAADRLRADFERGGMMPRLGVDWSGQPRGGPAQGAEHIEDAALGARDRMNAALAAIGPDLASVAVDACCLLIGLADLERKHGLPQRSGKVVLRLGLRALARHYRM